MFALSASLSDKDFNPFSNITHSSSASAGTCKLSKLYCTTGFTVVRAARFKQQGSTFNKGKNHLRATLL